MLSTGFKESANDARVWDSEKGIWAGEKAVSSPVATTSEILSPLWIFGYGSLCFKNDDIPAIESVNCLVRGYVRRFWQLSADHRGTPQ
jgi:hypothetical protein